MSLRKNKIIGPFKAILSLAGVFFFIVFLLQSFACNPSSSKTYGYPDPGQMSLLSMEEAGEIYTGKSFIENGDFSLWNEGAPSPERFYAPSNSKVSRLARRGPRGGPGENSVDQFWYATDANRPYSELFHTIVPDITPGKKYELYVHSLTYDNTSASVSLFAVDKGGSVVGKWPDAITIEPGHQRGGNYTFTLQTAHEGSLVVASHANAQTPYPGRTIWLEWRLTALPIVSDTEAQLPEPLK